MREIWQINPGKTELILYKSQNQIISKLLKNIGFIVFGTRK